MHKKKIFPSTDLSVALTGLEYQVGYLEFHEIVCSSFRSKEFCSSAWGQGQGFYVVNVMHISTSNKFLIYLCVTAMVIL